jgi:hypothetical protein
MDKGALLMEMIERVRELAAEMRPAMIDFAQRAFVVPPFQGKRGRLPSSC